MAGSDAADPRSAPLQPRPAEVTWEYAPAPESREIVTLAAEYGLFINGEFAPAAAGGPAGHA